jgi:hypothetical protein
MTSKDKAVLNQYVTTETIKMQNKLLPLQYHFIPTIAQHQTIDVLMRTKLQHAMEVETIFY